MPAPKLNLRKAARGGKAKDFSQFRQNFQGPPSNYISLATVGYGLLEPTPAFMRMEEGDVLVEVTLQPDEEQCVARLGLTGAGNGWGYYVPVEFGCQVILAWPDGSANAEPTIVARLWDNIAPLPVTVAGVATGGPGLPPPAPATGAPQFQFIKTPDGQLFAIEAGLGGDLLMHSGTTGSIHIKSDVAPTAAIHLDGSVHLGAAPTTPPTAGQTLPAGQTAPGVPAVPKIYAVPPGGTPIATLTIPPFAGDADAIVRARDTAQSNITIDPAFWAWITGASAILAAIGLVVPTPVKVDSQHASASLKHTAQG